MGSHQKFNDGNKQVRVDNWGVFFLQRLQAFFNKTDYCDLTLQFEGNVQLKVHRLVINACTEYFQILEQTCEMIDDVLMMPADLQADVILPIVNFMYTGMLEFHTSIFDKLYKTANLMNITVLTKLLDAQRGPVNQNQPKIINKKFQNWKSLIKKSINNDLPAPLPGRKLPIWKRKSVPTSVSHSVIPHFYQDQKRTTNDSLSGLDNAPKPTRFEWPEDDLSTFNSFESNFDEISYTSKPLMTQEDEPRPSTSFDRIRDSIDTNQQRTASDYENLDIDMDDVRDYVKEQKIRSSINMHEDDDDHDIDNDFESDGEDIKESHKRKRTFDNSVTKRVRFNPNEKENQVIKQTKINITPTGKTNSDVDHTKIISEVLKKYPNLVKKNKNIRLKILAKSNVSPAAIDEVKKTAFKKTKSSYSGKTSKAPLIEEKNDDDGPWKCLLCSTPEESVDFVLYYLFRKHMTDVHNEKFDTRMCKYCGHKSSKYNNLVYHQYTRHCIKPPPAYNFPKCTKCPFIALNDNVLIRHKLNHTNAELQCMECKITFTNNQTLTAHNQITGHNNKSGRTNYDCQYCIKKFPYGTNLFAHIRLQHFEDARRDGIVSLDELEDDDEQQELFDEPTKYMAPDAVIEKSDRIKIIQDVKLPTIEQSTESLNRQNLALEPSSEAEALSNVASGIATSLGLVDVVVLDDNQQYILHTENQPISTDNDEYIIPDIQDSHPFTTNEQEQSVITQSMLHSANIGSTDELVMVLTDHDYGDGNNELINNENSKIVVLYSHPIGGTENQFITSQGNLMLTSQAGLIELRNGNTVVTSTASHFITTNSEAQENAQIESIEMIQREINQHPDVKNKQLEVDSNETANIQNVTENINQIDESPTILSTTQNGEAGLQQTINEDLENVGETSSLESSAAIIEKSPNDTNNAQMTQNESSLETSNVLEKPSQINSEEPAEEINATAEPELTKDVPLGEIVNDETEKENTAQEVTNEVTSQEEKQESSTMEIQSEIPEKPTDASIEASIALSTDVSESSERESTSLPEPIKNTTSQITENVNETSTSVEVNILQATPEDQELEAINLDVKTEDEKPFPIDHFRVKQEAQLNEEKAQIEGFHLPLHEEASNSSEIQDTESQDESQTEQDNLQTQTEDENSQPLNKNPELEEENLSLDPEGLSLEQENSSLEQVNLSLEQENLSLEQENSSLEQENSTLEQVNLNLEQENLSLEHESSSLEQASLEQDVPSPNLINLKSIEVSKNKSNQSAKVILADWDDTDSQQSDSKSGTNVNKLIDDWDDDDDDKKDMA